MTEELTTDAVFIVGVSRSGTTLMRHILERSSLVSVCRENHFLGHLVSREGVRQHLRRRFGDGTDDRTATRIVDFIYGGGLESASRWRGMSRQWRWTVRHVPRDAFLERFLTTDRSDRALFDLVLRTYAEHEGKPIMGEKTPAHVRHVDTIFEWFPRARVIHMVRDPRAIYVSERRRRADEERSVPYRFLRHAPPLLAAFVLLETTLAWLESVGRLARHERRYPDRYLAVRFEDLVTDPEGAVRRVCTFLDIPFEAPMLEQVVVSRGHRVGAAGFDRAAADRWRGRIGSLAGAWFRILLGGRLRRLGYRA